MSEPRVVEEQYLREQTMSMRVIINRSHAHLRFMDFRVGNYDKKRDALDRTARAEGLRKVFTIVEKQDSKNWRSVGFVREGVYPAFFRTADAYAMCRHYDENGNPLPPQTIKKREEPEYPKVALHKPGELRVTEIKDEASKEEVMEQFNGHFRSLPFGRASSPDMLLKATVRRKTGWACAEIDDSYGHATVGFYPTPAAERGPHLGAQALMSLLEALGDKRINNFFGLSAADDEHTNSVFSQLDFHVTGRLAGHLQTDEGTSTALIWHHRVVR